jgi:phospholipid transport system substrate-binding protein
MTTTKTLWLVGSFALLGLVRPVAAAETADDKAVQKTLKTLVNSIRYNKDDVAAKQLSFEAMAKGLLQDTWAGLSEADRKEFLTHLETLIRRMSFTKGRDMFQYLDAVLYDPVKMQGDAAHCKSTVVVHRELKKTEIPIEWVLVREGGAWKVADTVTLGESTTEGIRQDQVLPLLKEGGVPALMDALRKKAAELKKA